MIESRSGFGAIAVLALVAAGAVTGACAAERDLALGRPYTWSRQPNYRQCTDAGDRTQLTDGALVRNDWGWLDPGMVGWELQPGDVVAIRIDLGALCEIDSVRFFTRSGPPSLLVGVSASDSLFDPAGSYDATRFPPPDPKHPLHLTLDVPLHGAPGRYVLVAALLRTAFLFCEEIEVHGREATSLTGGRAPQAPAPGPQNVAARRPKAGLAWGDSSFGRHDLDRLAASERRLWAVRAALPGALQRDVAATREEDERLAERAARWRDTGAPPLRVLRVDPWAPTTPWSAPLATCDDTLDLCRGAWGAAAIEVASAAETSLAVTARAAPTPAGAPRLVLRGVTCVESRDGAWAGDALPRLHVPIDLRPGATQQIWIDVDARRAASGLHRLPLLVGRDTLQLCVRVHGLRQPRPPLAAGNTPDPRKYPLTRAVPEAAVSDCAEHGFDSVGFAEENVPWPDPAQIDARGHLLRAPDFGTCDAALSRSAARRARYVGWFWNFDPRLDDPSRGHFRHPYLSPAWRQAVSEWLGLWLAHLRARGDLAASGGPRLYMMPYDETAAAPVVELLRFLKRSRPKLSLALTLTRSQSDAEVDAVDPWIDIAIFERVTLPHHAGRIRRRTARRATTWVYDVPQPSKSVSPTVAYRALPWDAWARGLQGCSFWAYADTGWRSADAWNDFDDERSDYAVVYGQSGAPSDLGQPLCPSKRWQAFRIGMQDVAILAAASRQRDLRPVALAQLANPSASGFDALVHRALRRLE